MRFYPKRLFSFNLIWLNNQLSRQLMLSELRLKSGCEMTISSIYRPVMVAAGHLNLDVQLTLYQVNTFLTCKPRATPVGTSQH